MTATQPDWGHTTFAEDRRTQKAVQLEAFLHSRAVTAAKAEQLPEHERRFVERAAGVRRCSDETWRLVVQLMRSAEDRAGGA